MSLKSRIKRNLRRYLDKDDDLAGFGRMFEGSDPVRIIDGVNYALPISLPSSLRQALTHSGKLDSYLRESWSDAVKFQFDNPYKNDLPFSPVSEDPLMEWNAETRKRVLEACHAAYNRNPTAKRGVRYMANFAIGDGFDLTCYNDKVREWLEAFIDNRDNRIREYERQAACDLLVDGELILRYSVNEGQTVVSPQRPWELESIKTELGNFRRVEEYCFQLHQTQGDSRGETASKEEEVPADEILFVAINNHAYELRGRSELFPILPWLKAHKDWLENRARINYIKSLIAWIVRVRAINSAQIASVVARWKTPPKPGTVAIEHADTEVEAIAPAVGAGDAADDGRQLLLEVARGFGLPEYFMSDGQNANLASSTNQQLPALTTFADYQRTLIEELWRPLFRQVLQNAVTAGKLPDKVQKMNALDEPDEDEGEIDILKAFEVKYHKLGGEGELTLTQALQIQHNQGWVDTQTAQEKLGYDHDIISKRLDEEEADQIEKIAQGRAMPAPGRMNPAGIPASNGQKMPMMPDETQDSREKSPAS